MPTVWPLQSQCVAIDGQPSYGAWERSHIVAVPCPWTLHVGSIAVHAININKLCVKSLTTVLGSIAAALGGSGAGLQAAAEAQHIDRYDGSFNIRAKRGGTSLSMHALGRAIDFDAGENQQHSQHHFFTEKSLIVAKFEAEGWIWGGRWSPGSIDAMHFQAARVHP